MAEELKTTTLQLMTIIADETLESMLSEEILELGAKGYSATRIEGSGKSGTRDNLWDGENIKFEIITSEAIAKVILQRLTEKYFNRYPIITYFTPVQVMRPDHFI